MSKFMQDLWKLIKENWTVEDKDETWERLVVLTNQIANKYRDEETKKIPQCIVQLLVGYLNYVEWEGCGRTRDYANRKTAMSGFEKCLMKKGLI